MDGNDILYEIKELDRLIIKKILNESKKNNQPHFSQVQIKIIKYLLKNQDKKVFQRDLEKVLGLRRSSISGILQTMEKNNLIKRIDVIEDARIKEIILTKEAKIKNKKMKEKFKNIQNTIEKNISKEDLETFLKVTKQIKENLQEGND